MLCPVQRPRVAESSLELGKALRSRICFGGLRCPFLWSVIPLACTFVRFHHLRLSLLRVLQICLILFISARFYVSVLCIHFVDRVQGGEAFRFKAALVAPACR